MKFAVLKASDGQFCDVIEINSLNELIEFVEESQKNVGATSYGGGAVILERTADGINILTIYDDYIE